MMVYALATRLDPATRQLLQRIREFNATMDSFERRMDAMLTVLEREKSDELMRRDMLKDGPHRTSDRG